jgi:type II secretory pathway pseudopilin PulG
MKSSAKGATLVEVLVIIAIGAIILGISFFTFYNLRNTQSLDQEVGNVLSYIERARSKSTSSSGFSEYGLHFTSTTTTVFKGKVYSASDSNNEIYKLPGGITYSAINLTGGLYDLYFAKVTGKPNVTGTLTLYSSSTGSTKVITIFATGLAQSN